MDFMSVMRDYRNWPGATWAKAIVAAVVVFLLLKLIGLWTLLALILGLAAFVFVVWLLHHDVGAASGSGHVTAPPVNDPAPGARAAGTDDDVGPPPASGVAAFASPVADGPEPVVEPVAANEGVAPVPSMAADVAPAAEGERPAGLSGPRDGTADDLKRIKGVGPKLEGVLNDLGIYHFDQIAAWSPGEVAWVDTNLVEFKGRCSRDDWVGQAGLLASGRETEFSQRVDKGDVY